jgi:uncharacterized delta-60 repeat protein
VTRFNANGTLDNSFGNGGTVTTNIAGFPITSLTAIVLDPRNGEILVGGSASRCAKCGAETVLARYNPDGSLDPGFGNAGTVVDKALAPGPAALALLSNGDISRHRRERNRRVRRRRVYGVRNDDPRHLRRRIEHLSAEWGFHLWVDSYRANSASATTTFSSSASCPRAMSIAHSTARSSSLARSRRPGACERSLFSRTGASWSAAKPDTLAPAGSAWRASTPMGASTPASEIRA